MRLPERSVKWRGLYWVVWVVGERTIVAGGRQEVPKGPEELEMSCQWRENTREDACLLWRLAVPRAALGEELTCGGHHNLVTSIPHNGG